MATFTKLKNPPIKEIIFTISFKEPLPMDKIEEIKSFHEIGGTNNTYTKRYSTQIISTPGQAPTTDIKYDGYLIKAAQSSKYIQIRQRSFSFHKINGYEDFNVLADELNGHWGILHRCVSVLTVNNISVRYLNFIEKGKEEADKDLLNIYNVNPFKTELKNNLSQLKFSHPEVKEIEVTITTTKSKQENKEGLVLDITLSKKIIDEDSFEEVIRNFNELRKVKNDLFFESITELTVKKYNQ